MYEVSIETLMRGLVTEVMCTVSQVISVFPTSDCLRSTGDRITGELTGTGGVRIIEPTRGVRVIRVLVAKEIGIVIVLVNLKDEIDL